MRRIFRTFLALMLALLMSVPALADNLLFTLASSAARTAPGSGTGVDVIRCRQAFVTVSVTAGSGTVSTFKVFLNGSRDGGSNFDYEIPCTLTAKVGGTTTANTQNIVNETAVVTSAKYAAICDLATDFVNVGWNIAGTTPSETFSVVMVCK